MNKIYYYIRNQYVESTKAIVPFNDAGFLYGDGLFETMRFDNRVVFSIGNHLDRLFIGLKQINLLMKIQKKDIKNLIYKLIDMNSLDSGIIRVMITRGVVEQFDNSNREPPIYISIKPFYSIPMEPVRVAYYDETKYPIIRFHPAIKSMNYIGNMLAKQDAKEDNVFEPVFYNNSKIITECAIRNIFYIKDNAVITPKVSLGILSGVMRKNIIDVCEKMNLSVIEKSIKLSDVSIMDEAFISSTGIGILPCYWDNWDSHFALTLKIKKELFKKIKNT